MRWIELLFSWYGILSCYKNRMLILIELQNVSTVPKNVNLMKENQNFEHLQLNVLLDFSK